MISVHPVYTKARQALTICTRVGSEELKDAPSPCCFLHFVTSRKQTFTTGSKVQLQWQDSYNNSLKAQRRDMHTAQNTYHPSSVSMPLPACWAECPQPTPPGPASLAVGTRSSTATGQTPTGTPPSGTHCWDSVNITGRGKSLAATWTWHNSQFMWQ